MVKRKKSKKIGITYPSLTNIIRRLCNSKHYRLSLYWFGRHVLDKVGVIQNDYDLLVIGSKKDASHFKSDLGQNVNNEYRSKLFFREHIYEEKPPTPYIHFLLYQDEEELVKRGWPTVINDIIKHNLLLYGSPLKINPLPITKKEKIVDPLDKGLQKVLETNSRYLNEDYRSYLSKIIPYLKKEYPRFKSDLEQFHKHAKKKLK